MNTIKNLFLFLFAGLLLVSCNKATYKKSKGGMPYQLFKGKDTQQVRTGDIVKIQITQKIKDSVYFTTGGGLSEYRKISPEQVMPYDISEIWTGLRLGDSLITTQMLDTFIKRDPARIPPQFQKGDKIMTYIKILKIFTSDSAAQADFEKMIKDWQANEATVIEKYLADKKITAQKTPSGSYVEIINPGTGNLIDSGNHISVNYSGTSWSGKKFDSNVDSAFGHVGPSPFIVGAVGQGASIKGFDEGMKFLRLGAKAKFYIPSMLGYGGNPTSPNIKPYENLIFDIEILDVSQGPPPPPADIKGKRPQLPKVDAAQPNKPNN